MFIPLLNTIMKIIFWFLIILIGWLIITRIGRKILHFPAPAFIGYFLDSNYRRRIQPPEPLIKRSGIKPGMRVLEIGCGSGAYTTFVARTVGPTGKVEALDIQPAMLKQLEKKLALPEHRDIRNITTYVASAYDLPFDDGTIDLVYMIAVLYEIPDQEKVLAEIKRVLKPEGILAVTEFLPDPDYPLMKTVVRLGERNGFINDGVLGNIWTYTVRLRKP
jgi:ubiquinone/menaquinone biosynthesis C-methylase UbiE